MNKKQNEKILYLIHSVLSLSEEKIKFSSLPPALKTDHNYKLILKPKIDKVKNLFIEAGFEGSNFQSLL